MRSKNYAAKVFQQGHHTGRLQLPRRPTLRIVYSRYIYSGCVQLKSKHASYGSFRINLRLQETPIRLQNSSVETGTIAAVITGYPCVKRRHYDENELKHIAHVSVYLYSLM